MNASLLPNANEARSEIWKEILTAVGLSTGAALALGLSRFAYALLLPPMREDLGWSYVEAGSLNTANGIGYIAGALVAAWTASRWGKARAFIASFAISVSVLLLTAATSSFSVLLALRTVGGISTAVTFILGAALASAICPTQNPRWRSTLVGLYVAGVGIGLLSSGIAIPLVLRQGSQNWPWGWAVLGLLGLVGLPPAWRAARSVAESSGGSLAAMTAKELRQLAPTFVAYGLFGAGYVGYMTFIIALLQKQGGSGAQVLWFWIVLGLVSAVSTLLWGRVLGGFADGRGPAMVFATSMLGALPVLIHPGSAAMFASAVLFGGSFLAGPASIAILTQHQLPAASWTVAISLLTVAFGIGQALSPILAGAISDAMGSIVAGFWLSPILLGVAAFASLLQRAPNVSAPFAKDV